MLKDVTNCPQCGAHLADTGVYEVSVRHRVVSDEGTVLGEIGSADTKFQCAACKWVFEFRDSDDSDEVQLMA